MNLKSWLSKIFVQAEHKQDFAVDQTIASMVMGQKLTEADIFKAYIPNFLYKPPYGFPRRVNLPYIRMLSNNPYVFSVLKTLADEASAIDWDVRVKEEFQDGTDYSAKIKEIKRFLNNPNGNDESFQHILRMLIFDILTTDSGVIVKVFNPLGKMNQIFVRDGATFLKNPDIYGYMGNKAEFIPPNPYVNMAAGNPTVSGQIHNYYDTVLSGSAAYFQYGWTAGSMPVPFGRRELVYIMQNPQPNSIYGLSPVEVLGDIILTLVYGSTYNLDFYSNNNMPDGVIQLIGAQREQIKAFRENWESQFKFRDAFGTKRRRYFQFPISSTEVKFTPFQLLSKDLEIISQQEWFTKILWMCFGVTADEMGFTETSNRAVAQEQAKIFKRKAVKPLLDVIKYHINTQLLTEFFDNADFGDVPIEFEFTYTDVEEELKVLEILRIEKELGIKTVEMIAKERGVDIVELRKSKAEAMAEMQQTFGTQAQPGIQQQTMPVTDEHKPQNIEQKPSLSEELQPKDEKKTPFEQPKDLRIDQKAIKSPDDEIEDMVKSIGKKLVEELDKLG